MVIPKPFKEKNLVNRRVFLSSTGHHNYQASHLPNTFGMFWIGVSASRF